MAILPTSHMQRKLVLLIGLTPTHEKQILPESLGECRCVFAENGLRGLAAAMVLKPDVVICQRNVSLLPASFIRHEVLSANGQCTFLILNNGEIA